MFTKSQLVGFCLLTIVFVALLMWNSFDLFSNRQDIIRENTWPDQMVDRSHLDWIEEYWQVEPFPGSSEGEVFRFWHFTSFRGAYVLKLHVTSDISGAVSLNLFPTEELKDNDPPWLESFNGSLSKKDIAEFRAVLDSVHFWTTPPGDLGWICADGEGFVVETNIGGTYRLWGNSCEASVELQPVSRFAFGVADRVSRGDVRKFTNVPNGI